MFFSRPAGSKYTDRGDPAAPDFDKTFFNVAMAWTDIDLSSIVPVGAKMVLLAVLVQSSLVNNALQFKKNGNTNFNAGDGAWTQVANVKISCPLQIPCDRNRIIEYFTPDLTWTVIEVVVKGWFV